MGQVGVYSVALLAMHDHLTADRGGILNAYSRDGAYRTMMAGAAVSIANNTERNSNAGAYVMLKEIQITAITDDMAKGTFRITWDLKNSIAGKMAFSKIYINGVAVGVEMSDNTGGYIAQSDDITQDLAPGDLIQIYGKTAAGGVCYVRNMVFCFSWRLTYFGQGTKNVLAAPLALSDADNPFTTVNVA